MGAAKGLDYKLVASSTTFADTRRLGDCEGQEPEKERIGWILAAKPGYPAVLGISIGPFNRYTVAHNTIDYDARRLEPSHA